MIFFSILNFTIIFSMHRFFFQVLNNFRRSVTKENVFFKVKSTLYRTTLLKLLDLDLS